MEIEKNFYELYMSFISSAVETYRKETILTPFPSYFLNGNEKDFGIKNPKLIFSKITKMYR